MISNMIPAVLTFDPPQASISTERALKNARELLLAAFLCDPVDEDRVQAALDDLELMMKAIQ